MISVEPVYTPVYAIQVKNTYVSQETGESLTVSSGIAPAPASMIPPGMSWREITTPRTEERRPEKEKVVL